MGREVRCVGGTCAVKMGGVSEVGLRFGWWPFPRLRRFLGECSVIHAPPPRFLVVVVVVLTGGLARSH